MSKNLEQILESNIRYADTNSEFFGLDIKPKRKIAILTCMDARLDPQKFSGLQLGDAHIIRNAGGRASNDALRSLVISYNLLGTNEVYVVHHTDCGMLTFTDDVMKELLAESLDHADHDGKRWINTSGGHGSIDGEYINWLTFSDLEQSVIDDLKRIRNHPLIPDFINSYGLIYDVEYGILREVHEKQSQAA